MQDKVEQFAEAHRAVTGKMVADAARFNHEIVGYPIPTQPELVSDDRAGFRADFMQEELDEFRKAQKEGDLDGAVDAIIDLMYVAAGAMNEMGVAIQPCWDEVHNANMRKKRGAMSKRPGSKGYDAVKPEGWTAPSLADYLTITSEDVQTILAIRRGEAKVVLAPRGKPVVLEDFGAVEPERKAVEPSGLPRLLIMGYARPRLLIMGYARHGKDTVCELLRDLYGFRFTSSSQFCAERVVFPALQKRYAELTIMERPDVPIYETAQQCFDDRANHRKLWYNLITAHNTPDLARLGREIFEGHDVYCGIRNAREFHALRNAGVFDVAIWVDASARGLPAEGKDSCTVEPWMADFVLDNSGSLDDLSRNLGALMGTLIGVLED